MLQRRAIIHSRHALVKHCLSKSLLELDWLVVDDDSPVDVAIVEVSGEKDIQFLEKISIPVVVFSSLVETKLIGFLLDYDVKGVVRLSSDMHSISETMNAVYHGGEYFDELIITYLLSDKYREIHERISSLSNREHQIITGTLADLTNDEIANKFGLSVRTVNAHKRNVLQKMKERSLTGVIKTMITYTLRYP